MNINTIFRRTDKEIASAVRQALDRDVSVPNTRIRITVSDGWVTLEGQVRTYSQRDDVVRAARNVAGMIGVRNWIVVEQPLIEPEEVREVIENALEIRADRLADRIKIAVDGGEVILKGTLRSNAEKRAVLGALSHTRGVFSIRDHLAVHRSA